MRPTSTSQERPKQHYSVRKSSLLLRLRQADSSERQGPLVSGLVVLGTFKFFRAFFLVTLVYTELVEWRGFLNIEEG